MRYYFDYIFGTGSVAELQGVPVEDISGIIPPIMLKFFPKTVMTFWYISGVSRTFDHKQKKALQQQATK